MLRRFFDKVALRVYLKGKSLDQSNRYSSYREKYNLHPTFRFNGEGILLYGEGKIEFGRESYIGEFSTWQSSKGQKISIGDNCRISHNVRCYTSSKKADSDFSKENIPVINGDVKIGDAVWIGANVFINPGVEIGNNSIIGANSVVVSDIPEFSIYGGVPAKLIRMKSLS